MKNNPRDWRIEQVATVCADFGIALHCPGGSHHVARGMPTAAR